MCNMKREGKVLYMVSWIGDFCFGKRNAIRRFNFIVLQTTIREKLAWINYKNSNLNISAIFQHKLCPFFLDSFLHLWHCLQELCISLRTKVLCYFTFYKSLKKTSRTQQEFFEHFPQNPFRKFPSVFSSSTHMFALTVFPRHRENVSERGSTICSFLCQINQFCDSFKEALKLEWN